MMSRLLHLTRSSLSVGPPSPPHGGGEGSCGGQVHGELQPASMHVNWGHEPRLLHLTRFRLRLRSSKPPSPPHGGGEGSCGGQVHGELQPASMHVNWGHELWAAPPHPVPTS